MSGAIVCAVAIASIGQTSAADRATLRGTLTYKGPATETKPLEVDHDMDCCAKKPIYQELLLVSEEGGVRNGVV